MNHTIKSKKLDSKFEFWVPNVTYAYIHVSINNGPNIQICERGSTMGSTLSIYNATPETFKNVCKKWYRSYLRNKFNY